MCGDRRLAEKRGLAQWQLLVIGDPDQRRRPQGTAGNQADLLLPGMAGDVSIVARQDGLAATSKGETYGNSAHMPSANSR